MSESSAGFKEMLREALGKAREKAPQANDDLIGLVSEASEAVSEVTGGAARLELSPIAVTGDDRPTYQLQLRRNDDSDAPWSDLGVFRVSVAGYPIDRWYSRGDWESRPDDPHRQQSHIDDLSTDFGYMMSNENSRLVILINYLQQLKAAR